MECKQLFSCDSLLSLPFPFVDAIFFSKTIFKQAFPTRFALRPLASANQLAWNKARNGPVLILNKGISNRSWHPLLSMLRCRSKLNRDTQCTPIISEGILGQKQKATQWQKGVLSSAVLQTRGLQCLEILVWPKCYSLFFLGGCQAAGGSTWKGKMAEKQIQMDSIRKLCQLRVG